MKTLFYIFVFLVMSFGTGKAWSQESVQIFDGIDSNDSPCVVEIWGYQEEVDPNVGTHNIGFLTNVKKTMQLRVNFQYRVQDLLEGTSLYDRLYEAYEDDLLVASNEIEKNRYEHIELFLHEDPMVPQSLKYYREAKVSVFGIEFGEVRNSCKKLKLREEEKDN